jgi:N-acetylglucosaminyldiphosphoundecaprenol N-acetyl-beta-D-mannosaminyltransferase
MIPDRADDLRVNVLGVHVSAIDMDSAVTRIERWVECGDRQYVCATGAHGVIESQKDSELRRIHNESGMTTPDGMPIVWSAHRAGATWVQRVYGPDLVLEIARVGAEKGWSIFYYGGAEGVADELAATLEERFPGLKTAGTYCPPFRDLTDDERADVETVVNASGATIVLVGLSTPKQERWMSEHRRALTSPVLIGVGAAFDFHTGRVRQAPQWMQRSGWEWAYRVTREPQRLWRRYAVTVPSFLARSVRCPPVLLESVRSESSPVNNAAPDR